MKGCVLTGVLQGVSFRYFPFAAVLSHRALMENWEMLPNPPMPWSGSLNLRTRRLSR